MLPSLKKYSQTIHSKWNIIYEFSPTQPRNDNQQREQTAKNRSVISRSSCSCLARFKNKFRLSQLKPVSDVMIFAFIPCHVVFTRFMRVLTMTTLINCFKGWNCRYREISWDSKHKSIKIMMMMIYLWCLIDGECKQNDRNLSGCRGEKKKFWWWTNYAWLVIECRHGTHQTTRVWPFQTTHSARLMTIRERSRFNFNRFELVIR